MLFATPASGLAHLRGRRIQPKMNVDPGSIVHIWQYLLFTLTSILEKGVIQNINYYFRKDFMKNYLKHSDTAQDY